MRLKKIPRKIAFATFAFVSVIAPKIGVIHIECSLPNPNNPSFELHSEDLYNIHIPKLRFIPGFIRGPFLYCRVQLLILRTVDLYLPFPSYKMSRQNSSPPLE